MKPMTNHPSDIASCDYLKFISWPAIFSGVAISLVITALFNLLGLGLGFISFQTDAEAAKALGIMAIIWLTLSGIISMFIGGWFTGMFCKNKPGLHGLVSWSVATLLILFLAFSMAGTVIGGVGNILKVAISSTTSIVSSAGKGLLQAVPQANLDKIVTQAQRLLLNPTAKNNDANGRSKPAMSADEVKNQLGEIITTTLESDENGHQTAYDQAVNFLRKNTDMNQEKAEQTVNEWQEKYIKLKKEGAQKAEEMRVKSQEAAEKASDILGSIALVIALEFLLGAIAGCIGAIVGFRHYLQHTPNNHLRPTTGAL